MSEITKLTPEPTENDMKETSQTEFDTMKTSTVKCTDMIRTGKYRISPPAVKPSKLALT